MMILHSGIMPSLLLANQCFYLHSVADVQKEVNQLKAGLKDVEKVT